MSNQEKAAAAQHSVHTIPPVYDENSRVLILGSFPSVKSRAQQFFYGHPQNRFWRVLAAVLECSVPESVAEKKTMLLAHGVALWDVIASCRISGSADASIRDAVPNDLTEILRAAPIRRIFCNGGTADALYRRYLLPQTGVVAEKLPSTSPANAGWTMEKLIEVWSVIRC